MGIVPKKKVIALIFTKQARQGNHGFLFCNGPNLDIFLKERSSTFLVRSGNLFEDTSGPAGKTVFTRLLIFQAAPGTQPGTQLGTQLGTEPGTEPDEAHRLNEAESGVSRPAPRLGEGGGPQDGRPVCREV